ncbi:MAG: putative DNA binding domain-containing protein [Candidatus Omnitrophica bacterium]|nr:putative DNA binding domain-containing protein [Candidatus Omnitrophota bacterium]
MKSDELKLIIKEGEGLTVEFKERYSPRIDRNIVAFANTKGGRIILGVSDDGRMVSEKLTNKLKAEIVDLARKCEPAINVKRVVQVDNAVVIEVEEGNEKPYSCASGYFRRLDGITQKMSRKEIEFIFRHAFKTSFEFDECPKVKWDDISKEKISGFFKEADIAMRTIDEKKVLMSLGMSDGKHVNNAGVLFFSKEPQKHILHCEMILAAFKGKNRLHIYDRKDVRDDLLTQFNEAMTFIQKHLNVRSEIQGINRKDIYELPLDALREAVANAIVHRDYSMSGTSIYVEVHEDRVEIKNPGALPMGMKPAELIGTSIRRNHLIADIFARMEKVERMGTGILRMREAMKKWKLPYPKIKSDVFFSIAFKRPKYSLKAEDEKGGQKKQVEKVTNRATEKFPEGSQKSSQKILASIERNPEITIEQLAQIIQISGRAIKKNIRQLKEDGLLKRIGPDKGGYWEVQ